MIGIVGGFFAIIAAVGIAYVAHTIIKITFNWVRNKINSLFRKRNTKKVFMQDVKEMIRKEAEKCENRMSREEFNNYKSELNNYDLVVADIDGEGQVQDIELVKNTDAELDEEVEKWLGSKREILVTD